MSINEITSTVHELRELLRMEEELNAQIEALKDQLKAHMAGKGTDTISGTDYKVTWKEVESTRFDTTAFKKAHADLYATDYDNSAVSGARTGRNLQALKHLTSKSGI